MEGGRRTEDGGRETGDGEGAGVRVGAHLGTGREKLAALGARPERCCMRRLFFGAWCVMGVVALAGCQGGSGGGGPAGSLSEDYSEALPVVTQLVVGSL